MREVRERKRERTIERVGEGTRVVVRELVFNEAYLKVSGPNGLTVTTTMTTRGSPGPGSEPGSCDPWRDVGPTVG